MKVQITYVRAPYMSKGVVRIFECDKVWTPQGRIDFAQKNTVILSIADYLVAEWEILKEESKLDSQIEQYLQENYGNLQTFYSHFATNPHAGQSLRWALCQPDLYRLQKSGKFNELNGEREIDSPKIVEILEWLKEDAVNYPEDHPLWNQRKNR